MHQQFQHLEVINMKLNKKVLDWVSKGLCFAGLLAVFVGAVLVLHRIRGILFAVSGVYFVFGIGAALAFLGFVLRAVLNYKNGILMFAAAAAAGALCLPLAVIAFTTDTYIWLNLCTAVFLFGLIGYSCVAALNNTNSHKIFFLLTIAVGTVIFTVIYTVNYANYSQYLPLYCLSFAACLSAVSVGFSH
jgi:hypothetical protein